MDLVNIDEDSGIESDTARSRIEYHRRIIENFLEITDDSDAEEQRLPASRRAFLKIQQEELLAINNRNRERNRPRPNLGNRGRRGADGDDENSELVAGKSRRNRYDDVPPVPQFKPFLFTLLCCFPEVKYY